MREVRILPPAARYFKKMKDRNLKALYKEAVQLVALNPFAGSEKGGDLAGVYSYDIYYNRTNYELAYTIEKNDDGVIVIILAGTRENFYEQLKRYMKQL